MKTKTLPKPKRKPLKKIHRFALTTPNAGNILDLGEIALLDSAIRKATTGGAR